jgi:POT family proton-dependent oligopeptide transporter
MSSLPAAEPAPESRLGRHPRGLYVLFGAEMWERFSYYGMRALLVLYLMKHLNFARDEALALYATYTGLVYLTPLLGGYLADRHLGQRKAVFIGGLLMAVGQFALMFDPLLYFALGLLILGNGFFKPNISTMVGQLYPEGDSRRDSGYTIFYMGINTGAFLSPLICGYLGESPRFGWHYGFAAAGVGMVLGLLNFLFFQRSLGAVGGPPGGRAALDLWDWVEVLLVALLGAGFVYVAIATQHAVFRATGGGTSGWFGVLAYWTVLAVVFAVLLRFILRKPQKPVETADSATAATGSGSEDSRTRLRGGDWQRIVAILIVAAFSILFWMGFEQAGGTFTLFADEQTDRSLPAALQRMTGDETFPASLFQTINPLLIVLLAPFPLMLWNALDRAGWKLNSAAKMGIGLILLGLGFIVMNYAETHFSPEHKAAPYWLAAVYAFCSIGELCLSPIGLSLVNRLAPARVASLMMAIWFLCTAAANFLAGTLEHFLKTHHPELALFNLLIWTSIGSGVLLLAINPLLKKLAHGRL